MKPFIHFGFALILAAALGCNGGTEQAQQQQGAEPAQTAQQQGGGMQPGADQQAGQQQFDPQHFLAQAQAISHAEVELAQVAQKQAKNRQVKQFAKELEQDHTRNLDKLQKLITQANLTTGEASDLRENLQQTKQDLQQAKQDFDQKFADAMVQDHQKALDLFRQAQNQLQQQPAAGGQQLDPEARQQIEQYVNQSVPVLEQHLQEAQQLQQQVNQAQGGGDQNQ